MRPKTISRIVITAKRVRVRLDSVRIFCIWQVIRYRACGLRPVHLPCIHCTRIIEIIRVFVVNLFSRKCSLYVSQNQRYNVHIHRLNCKPPGWIFRLISVRLRLDISISCVWETWITRSFNHWSIGNFYSRRKVF